MYKLKCWRSKKFEHPVLPQLIIYSMSALSLLSIPKACRYHVENHCFINFSINEIKKAVHSRIKRISEVYKHDDCKCQCYKPAFPFCHLSNAKASVCQEDRGLLTAECCGHVNLWFRSNMEQYTVRYGILLRWDSNKCASFKLFVFKLQGYMLSVVFDFFCVHILSLASRD